MKIVITGSESFIGKVLIRECARRGKVVVGFDLVDKPSPVKDFSKSRGVNSDYEYHKVDIRSADIEKYFPEEDHVLVHLAALSRDPDCRDRAYECFDINVMGTLNLMRAAKKAGTKQFIFASSEWVYEKFKEGEEKNEDAFIDIADHASEYALSKLVSEANLREQHGRGFCDATILRFGIIYGPRVSNWSAVESLFNSVRNGEEIRVGSLKTGRRFVHVEDIVRGILQSVDLGGFNIVNLTGDKVFTLGEIIETSERILGKKAQASEASPENISVRNPSNTKAKKLINWSPKINLEEGLKTLLTND